MADLIGIFSRHIIIRTFTITVFVYLGITALDLIFSIIGDAEDLNNEFNLNDLITITLYGLLHDSMDYIQGSCLLGALISLGLFNRDGNLTVIRSNGLSPIKISTIFALGPIIFSLIMVSLDNKIFIQAANYAEKYEQQKNINQNDINFSWVKDGNKLLRYSSKNDLVILNPTLITLDENGFIIEINSSEQAQFSNGYINFDKSEFIFSVPEDENLDRSNVGKISIGDLATYLKEKKIDRKQSNFVKVEFIKRLLLPFSVLFLILTAAMLFFRSQRNKSFGPYVVGGFLGAFIFNLIQEFFFSMGLTIQSNIIAISLMPYFLLLFLFYFLYKRI